MLSELIGTAHPLVALPLETIIDPQAGAFLISPYAGVDVAQMRAGEWKDCAPQQLEEKCQDMAACLLMATAMHESVVSG